MKQSYVIGVDYGTDSVRSVIVNAANGKEVVSSTFYYPRWKQGLYCNASENQYRQHPLDYIEGLIFTIQECIGRVSPDIQKNIKAIGIDTTGSTPCAISREGIPLAMLSGFEENPNAMFNLWKDHTAIVEANLINETAKKFKQNYLDYVGGIYSSEWFWAKALHISKADQQVKKEAYTWMEHSDWMPFLLTGKKLNEVKRNVCAAGHKALWAEAYEGFPPSFFFKAIDPYLEEMVLQFPGSFITSDKPIGTLSSEWAQKLRLSTEVIVAGGMLDAHAGAVGAEITPYELIKIIGTSTCDIMTAPRGDMNGKLIKGICGQVYGSVLPGFIGLEAGQSAFGDIFQWYVSLLSWSSKLFIPDQNVNGFDKATFQQTIFAALSNEAAQISIDENIPISIDWFNGRRTPDANQSVTASVHGLTLGTNTAGIFRSLVEGACLGARKINDCFTSQGMQIKGITAIGGIPKKSPFVMQMLANVLQLPVKVHKSENTCALGAAINASLAAAIHSTADEAIHKMGQGFNQEYLPDTSLKNYYEKRLKRYEAAGEFIQTLPK